MPQTETRKTHTPGPWDSQPTAGHDTHGQSVVYAEDGKDIAVVYDGAANAKLVAAAPEMLEALEEANNWFDNPQHERRWEMAVLVHNHLKAAIRKARGTP